jgi:hypothetical protein
VVIDIAVVGNPPPVLEVVVLLVVPVVVPAVVLLLVVELADVVVPAVVVVPVVVFVPPPHDATPRAAIINAVKMKYELPFLIRFPPSINYRYLKYGRCLNQCLNRINWTTFVSRYED